MELGGKIVPRRMATAWGGGVGCQEEREKGKSGKKKGAHCLGEEAFKIKKPWASPNEKEKEKTTKSERKKKSSENYFHEASPPRRLEGKKGKPDGGKENNKKK